MLSLKETKRKSDKTRAKLLAAGYQLFISKGLEVCTSRDIVKCSQLSQGTFYNYFQKKEELFDEIVELLAAEIREEVSRARKLAQTPREFLENSFMAALRILELKPGSIQLIAKNLNRFRSHTSKKSRNYSALISELESDLRTNIEKGVFREFNPRWMTLAMINVCVEIVFDAHSKKEFNTQNICNFLVQLFSPQLLLQRPTHRP